MLPFRGGGLGRGGGIIDDPPSPPRINEVVERVAKTPDDKHVNNNIFDRLLGFL